MYHGAVISMSRKRSCIDRAQDTKYDHSLFRKLALSVSFSYYSNSMAVLAAPRFMRVNMRCESSAVAELFSRR
jgi:hypothetical protein